MKKSYNFLRKIVIPEFVYGIGAISLVGHYAKNFGAKKALIVTDLGVLKAGILKNVTLSLESEKISYIIFSDVSENPRIYEVEKGASVYEKNNCDIIIAVGGGSPIDCAKTIGITYTNKKNPLEFIGVDEVDIPGPPLICIPTTSGSSADVSQFAILNDNSKNVKLAIISKSVVSDVSIIDPKTTITMTERLTAATGMDALSHAVEAYVSNASSSITDLHALAAMPLIVNNIMPAIKDPENLEYRSNMMLGSLYAGIAFSNASLGLTHAMAHSLGGLLDLPHGICNSLLLEHVVDFNYYYATEKYKDIGNIFGLNLENYSDEECKYKIVSFLSDLRKSIGITGTIGTLGVTKKEIPSLSINAFNDPCIVTNPRTATLNDIEMVYKNAL
ncbi:iron-containing alcohol dehydrogenase [Methanococcus vannielii SB]|jgi:alcohol dehydrogenase class IV|uniref:Iron-containing alcohol dehydrogenase n=1 Tax=Methanococcus vannielii (strain ATCC 35089 / DSM 1224 / JCM 13029 / OCM 148 / SB) TaxID=406327 RepID=A6UNI2_METVS|nr:alcohol dehydrogenase-like regulatory protein ErcA [Methanococcus vannielii]ABR54054.1 iron-containing alcohol dehydrogenase [Methanococcus vannielii SB]